MELGFADQHKGIEEFYAFFIVRVFVKNNVCKRLVVFLAEHSIDLDIVSSGYKLNKEFYDDFDEGRSVDVIRIGEVRFIFGVEILEYVFRQKFHNFVDVDDLSKHVGISVYYIACRDLAFCKLIYEKRDKRRHKRIFVVQRVDKFFRRYNAIIIISVFLKEILCNVGYFYDTKTEFFYDVLRVNDLSADDKLIAEYEVYESGNVDVVFVLYVERYESFGRYDLIRVALFRKQTGGNCFNKFFFDNVIVYYVDHAEVIHQEFYSSLDVYKVYISDSLYNVVKSFCRNLCKMRANCGNESFLSVLIAPCNFEKCCCIKISEESIYTDAVYHLGQYFFDHGGIAHRHSKIDVVGKHANARKIRNELFYLCEFVKLRKFVKFLRGFALGILFGSTLDIKPRAVCGQQTVGVKFVDKRVVKIAGQIGDSYRRIDDRALVLILKSVDEIHKRRRVDTGEKRGLLFRSQRVEYSRERQIRKLILGERVEFQKIEYRIATRFSYLVYKSGCSVTRHIGAEY